LKARTEVPLDDGNSSLGNSRITTDLRPIISRLQEIQRKCVSLGPRHQEAEAASARLDEIMDRLMAATEPDAEAPHYGEMARQLFAVERLFESLGFMSVAKEVAYVERALEAFEPEREAAPAGDGSGLELELETPAASVEGELIRAREPEGEKPSISLRERLAIPTPMGIALLLLLVAILGAIAVVQVHEYRQQLSALPEATPTPPVVALPSATPAPTRAPTIAGPPPTPTRFQMAADEIAKARLALREGELEQSISHLYTAARLHVANPDLKDTANEIIFALTARSDEAAADARWDDAEKLVERARELSLRFGFPTAPIDEVARRHASMVRFVKLRPDQLEELRASIGRRVIVYFERGGIEEGRIHGVTDSKLELDQSTRVGEGSRGGAVIYVESLPLAAIAEIQVFEE
jgi:hypothetical protein